MAFAGGTPSILATGSRNLSTLSSDRLQEVAASISTLAETVGGTRSDRLAAISRSVVSGLPTARIPDYSGASSTVRDATQAVGMSFSTITRTDLSDPPVGTWSGVYTGGDGHYLSLATREDGLRYVGPDHAAVLEHWSATLGAP